MESRIYEKKVNIDTEHTRMFYDQRARHFDEMECPYTTVLLGDQDPSLAERYNKFEKEYIFPKLYITSESNIIDIGCGIGRWAESVIPFCSCYTGTDFSSEMIATAQKRCSNLLPELTNYSFKEMSFQETVNSNIDLLGGPFDRMLVCGVCMYINDEDLESAFIRINDILCDNCRIYFTETIALKSRLTLDSHHSEALKTTYDVIYRSSEDYLKLYDHLVEKGFRIIESDFLPHMNKNESFRETDRWYVIMERQR